MKRLKRLSLFLCLTLVLTLLPVSINAETPSVSTAKSENGLTVDKTVKDNDDGTYTLTLEAFATGSMVTTETKEDIPTDIVLVLDQSGSMSKRMQTVSFDPYNRSNNATLYSSRNSNLWYQVPNEQKYVPVSVQRQEVYKYTKLNTMTNYYLYYYYYYWDLYVYINGEPVKVTKSRTSGQYGYNVFTYTANGKIIARSTGDDNIPTLEGTDDSNFYIRDVDYYRYIYQYTDNGNTVTIETSDRNNTIPNTTFYSRNTSQNGLTRLQALKTALTGFVNSVQSKAAGADSKFNTPDDVNHRVAVVGFAEEGQYGYENTEVFVGSGEYTYGQSARKQYGNALQSMNLQSGRNNVAASIGKLTASGATFTNFGVEMANGILEANPVAEDEKRNRVIVVFTDGIPGATGYDSDVADKAVSEAKKAKNKGVTVYTVGIFDGADATSLGSENGNDIQKANNFMQRLSSNDGAVQKSSYYLSASDADTLNSIFQQIADQVQSGGTASTLTEEAVVKDIVAPQFELVNGADLSQIKLSTWTYHGDEAQKVWTKDSNATALTAQIVSSDESNATTTNNTINVSGFDFSANYVGYDEQRNADGTTVKTPRGKKLVVEIPVKVRDGFLGGDNVFTNTNAAIYPNANSSDPVIYFPRPTVDVPIENVELGEFTINTYLLNGVTLNDVHNGTAQVGNVRLDLKPSAINYGLENWQTKYVNIAVQYKEDGKVGEYPEKKVTISDIKEDAEYGVKLTVTSKYNESNSKTASTESYIHVFKPVLAYKDSEVYYGDTAPSKFDSNRVSETWQHGDEVSTEVAMEGNKPTLVASYEIDPTKLIEVDGINKINSKQDISVNVDLKIRDTPINTYTEFVHTCDVKTDCSGIETSAKGKPAFLLHPQTVSLKIEKVAEKGKTLPNEPYVFTIRKDGVDYTQATIVGTGSVEIKELPVGTYTIVEDEDWSWRYNSSISPADGVILNSANLSGTITCTNKKDKNNWLNGYSGVETNTYGIAKKAS